MKALTNDIKARLIALGHDMAAASDRADFTLDDTAGVIAGLFEGKKKVSSADFGTAVTPWQQGIDSPEALDEWTPSDRARQFKSRLKARLAAEFFIQVEKPVKATTQDAERKSAEREATAKRMASHAKKVETLAKREAIPTLLAAAQVAEKEADPKLRREIMAAPEFAAKAAEKEIKALRARVIALIKECDDVEALRLAVIGFRK